VNDLLAGAVDWLYRAPGWIISAILSIVIGYVLRGIKSFPNGAIPLAIILISSIANMLLAGEEPSGMAHRRWLALNCTIGAIVGFCAWRFHHSVLRKYECKIPILKYLSHTGDTEVFTNTDKKQIDKP
jgi:hypothetical protein